MKIVRIALVVVVILLLVIQVVPVDRSNPPVESPLALPADVEAVVRQSCFDCHSNETSWPWYSYVAPVSWQVASHVEHGRKALNFSTAGALPEKGRDWIRMECWHEVDEGHMPIASYLWLHPDAKPTDEDRAVLERWAGGE
jgi:hypothetical protein